MLRKDTQEAAWPSFPHENTSRRSLCCRKTSADRIWWCCSLELPSFHKKSWRRTELLFCIRHRSMLFYYQDKSRLSHMASLSAQLCDYYCYWRLKHSLWCSKSQRSPLKLRAIRYLLPIFYKMNFGDYFPKHKIKELAFMISCPIRCLHFMRERLRPTDEGLDIPKGREHGAVTADTAFRIVLNQFTLQFYLE